MKCYVILQNVTCLTQEINNILFTDLPNGWPALQIRLLNELVYTARRLGDPSLAVRYDPSCVTVVAGASCMEKLDYMHLEDFNHGTLTYYKLFDMISFLIFSCLAFFGAGSSVVCLSNKFLCVLLLPILSTVLILC